MNNVFVYCELEGTVVAEVSLELLTKGRKLANQLDCQLEAIVHNFQPCRNRKTSIALRCRPSASSMLGLVPCTSLPLPYSSICLKKKSRKSA